MTTSAQAFADLSDGDLAAVHRLATDERRATVRLIASLVELDERRLYLAEPLARAAAGAASAALARRVRRIVLCKVFLTGS
jgi:hypothetical protein